MKGPVRPLRTASVYLGALLSWACLSAGRSGGELESRFATVHNALSAIGMSEVGALHEAHITDGQGAETKVDLDLDRGCTTVVAVGASSIADLDAALVDASGRRLARATAHTSEATIRACNEAAGTYTLRLKAAHGSGLVLVSTWSGGSPEDPVTLAARNADSSHTLGTCDAPLALSAGDFSGTTVHGEHQNESKGCQNTGAEELVYKLELVAREKVTVAVEAPRFDSVIYVRKSDCLDPEAEIACNDDAPPPGGTDKDQHHSRIEQVFEPGTYFIFVDGYSGQHGSFRMHVALADVPPLAELCNKAPVLAVGTAASGTTDGAFDNASAPPSRTGEACGDGAHGPDSIYSLPITRRSRLRVTMHSDDLPPVVHVRSRCDDPDTAIGCADSGAADHEVAFLGLVDPGSYAVFADTSQHDATGKFTLLAETAPELGSGVKGERCSDAIPLTKTELSVSGDTFAAHDDVAGTCGGTGAPDLVYRLNVATRTHLTAHITREEAPHVLLLLHGCDSPKAEVECGKAIDRIVPPGTYFLAVDGDSPVSFGKFTFDWNTHDTQAQDAACRAPTRLREGDTQNGTTLAGAVDKFSPSCATTDATGGAPDVVYQITLGARRRVHLHLHTGGWGGVLSVRRSCVDGENAAATGEIECRADDGPDVDFDSVLDPGKYYVVIDGKEPSGMGPFTLEYAAVR